MTLPPWKIFLLRRAPDHAWPQKTRKKGNFFHGLIGATHAYRVLHLSGQGIIVLPLVVKGGPYGP